MSKHDHLRSLPITERYPEQVWKALNYAAKAHEEQKRKLSGNHFIEHPFGVLEIVRQVSDDPEIYQAAVLHDTVEDTDCTVDDLCTEFNDRVGFLVWGVTKDDTVQDKHERDLDYLRRLEYEAEEGSIIIALADKIHNITDKITGLKSLGTQMCDKFTSNPAADLWWFTAVLEIGQRRLPDCPLNDRLQALIAEFDHLNRTAQHAS